jgi:catechol 2,3-dioxygenase-like lactoylglutathione lyase family enzyme
MINGISHACLYVLDQESAKEFYTQKLGFDLLVDMQMGAGFEGAGEGFRWLTVSPAGRPDTQFILADCGMGHDAETTEQVRSLVAKGALGTSVLTTDDCRATFRELDSRGVVFLSEPAERPYGIEAVFRDDSGNTFSLTQAFSQMQGGQEG